MATDRGIPELDKKGLREFGLTTGVAIIAIFGVFFPWLFERPWPTWPWLFAAPLWALALIHPNWLRWIYKAWMRFGLLASRVMTPLVLGVVFFVMISPMALVMRLTGKDPMQRTLDPGSKSYRLKSTKRPTDNLERPF